MKKIIKVIWNLFWSILFISVYAVFDVVLCLFSTIVNSLVTSVLVMISNISHSFTDSTWFNLSDETNSVMDELSERANNILWSGRQ